MGGGGGVPPEVATTTEEATTMETTMATTTLFPSQNVNVEINLNGGDPDPMRNLKPQVPSHYRPT